MANTRHSDEEMQKGNVWVGSSKATRELVVIGERYPPSQPETWQGRAQLDRGGSPIEVTVWCEEVCGTTRGEKSACSNKCLPGVAVETGSSSGRVFSTVFMAS